MPKMLKGGAEVQLRIYYHRRGGVTGWTKCNIRLSSFS